MIELSKKKESVYNFTPDQFCQWLYGYVILCYNDSDRFPNWFYGSISNLYEKSYPSNFIILTLKGLFDSFLLDDYSEAVNNVYFYMSSFFITEGNITRYCAYSTVADSFKNINKSNEETYFDDGQEA